MKRYYLILSRVSLAVILLQVLTLIHCGFNVGKINQRIDRVIESLEQSADSDAATSAVYSLAARQLAEFQQENRAGHWLLYGLIIIGTIHVAVCYSLYIHFLRWGRTWTKVCLHLNNLGCGLVLPSPIPVLWVPLYLIGTRVCKHLYVRADFRKDSLAS